MVPLILDALDIRIIIITISLFEIGKVMFIFLLQTAHINKLVENKTISSVNTHPMRVPDYKSPRAPATYMNLCTKCQQLDMQTRCSMACCERHCCLPVNIRVSYGLSG